MMVNSPSTIVTYLRRPGEKVQFWRFLYLSFTIAIHAILVGLTFSVSFSNGAAVGFMGFFYSIVISLPIAERIAQTILFLATRSVYLPPRLDRLTTLPRVALLYCTCDDAVEECLELLKSQQYDNLHIFVLDDSKTEKYRKIVDRAGYTVVKRPCKTGYKAGNLNYWLKTWGQEFDYFAIVDADSVLPPHFVYDMLLFGEHPQNSGVALFESSIHAWRPENPLQKALALQLSMSSEVTLCLSNRLGVVLSNGHNNLCRVSHLTSIGGFDERFIGEDHATTLNLIAGGFSCKVANVKSYEILPINLSVINKRAYRYVRSDFQLLLHPWIKVPLALQFKFVLKVLAHCLWGVIAFTMMRVLWAQQSTLTDLIQWGRWLFQGVQHQNPQLICILSIFFIYFLYLYLLALPQAISLRIGIVSYLTTVLLGMSLGFGNMFAILLGIMHTAIGKPFSFLVTPKQGIGDSLTGFVKDNWLFCVWVWISFLGVLNNPVSLVFNWPWMLPLLTSPLVLYWSQRRSQSKDKLMGA